MNEVFSLSVQAKTENLNAVLDFVGEKIEHCPMKVQSHIGIVIDEVFANICGYADTDVVDIKIKVDNCITLIFEDGGAPYNPLTAKAPDITLSADERKIGGLGIFMVKKLTDSVEYTHQNGKNILTIIKHLGG
jgi:anti-sigma regulatory factor (Ser/Thr protein kinase)